MAHITPQLQPLAVPVDSIHLDPANARKGHAVDRIAASLAQYGQRKPIVVNRKEGNKIEAGNGTYQAAVKLGWTEIAAVFVEDDPMTAVGYGIADNRLGDLSEWDTDTLQTLINSLDPELNLTTGFDEGELDSLLAELGQGAPPVETADAEPQVSRADELRQEWATETGQLWILPSRTEGQEHRLICGDCTDKAVVERVMAGERAALVSDPPYGINVDTSWLSALNVQRGKPANMSDDKLANDTGDLDLSWVYKYKEWLVFGFPYIARSEAYTGLLVWDKRGDGGENGLGNPVEVAASNAFNGYRLKRHVWAGYIREAGEKREPHPTQKPIGIMCDGIELVKSRVILDPFGGSGTTMVASENLGRQCRMVEIEPSYCAVILQRMVDAFGIVPELIKDAPG